MSYRHIAWRAAGLFSSALLLPALARAEADAVQPLAVAEVDEQTVVVEALRQRPAPAKSPAIVQTVSAEQLQQTVNLSNTEDALKYLPSLLVRKRYIGDTNAPVATRTTGINASARSLIYADGLLLSTLVNNNNGNGSPQWFLVPPGAIDHVDVLYGPYAAAYPGNSYGAVVEIATRTPEKFESSLRLNTSFQPFKQYGTDGDYKAYELGADLADRRGAFFWRLDFNHLDSNSQPVTYLTIGKSTTAAASGDPVISGAYADRNRTGGNILVLGAGNLTHTTQDSAVARLGYDFSSTLQLVYTLAYWQNTATTRPQTYLQDSSGASYIGNSGGSSGKVTINGNSYSANSIAALYSDGTVDQRRLAQGLSLTDRSETLDWQLAVSDFDYVKDLSRTSTPSNSSGSNYQSSSGRITDAGDTGWRTADARISYHPQGLASEHTLSAGVHADQYRLGSPLYDSADWFSAGKGALFSDSRGKTRTLAAWAQEQWRIAPAWTATVGARYEKWKAFDGFNNNRSGTSSFTYFPVQQPELDKRGVSPKATLAWQSLPELELKASLGRALRFPTVGELYQNIATGSTYTQANPYLKPEDVWAGEFSAIYRHHDALLRVTLFQETVKDLLISQNAQLSSTVTASFVQNLDKTRQRGVEVEVGKDRLFLDGLSFTGSATYVDAEILENDGYVPTTAGAHSVGRRTPYVAKWRASGVLSYKPDEDWTLSLAGRYATRLYATVDGSDINTHTYQGFEGYTVFDSRVRYQLDKHWSAALGVDNLNNEKYFLFHPFPQRSAFAELHYDF